MKITVAKNAGFCFGVNRAINIVYDLVDSDKKVCTLGPIIHNKQIINELKSKNVRIVQSPKEVSKDSVVVIRSHGVSSKVMEEIAELGLECVNATCPFVSRIHTIVHERSSNGDVVLIAGDADHPEVTGIKGHCESIPYIFSSKESLYNLLEQHPELREKSVSVVAQTTFNVSEWKICLIVLKKHCTKLKIFDTICNATAKRQEEAADLAKKSNLMLVIGDKRSSNTSKLKAVCDSYCKTFLIESTNDMPDIDLLNTSSIGITAGASTPDVAIKSIEEAINNMLEESKKYLDENQASDEINTTVNCANSDFNQDTDEIFDDESFKGMMEEALNNMVLGKKVKGTVVSVSPTEIFVDVGRKQSGIIQSDEFSTTPVSNLQDVAKVGDVYDLLILKIDDVAGTMLLSKKRIDSFKIWKDFKAAMEAKEVLTGKVSDVIKGGIIVRCKGQRIFIPASLASVSRNDSLESLKDKEVQFRIVEVNENRRHAIGSIKSVLLENREKELKDFWDSIEVGKHYDGEIRSLVNYGAFVNIGPVDGLLHISEFSWSRVGNIHNVAKVGDKIDVYVKDFDVNTQRVSLGHKDPNADPWTVIKKDYPEGSIVEVKIKNLTSFGAFGEIIPGVEGLIHISQISEKHIDSPKDVLKVGDMVMAMITGVDPEARRISLSIRKLLEGSADADQKKEKDTIDTENLGENITFTSDPS